MCAAIRRAVVPGGRFVALADTGAAARHPDRHRKYGIVVHAERPPHDGDPVRVAIRSGDRWIEFDSWYHAPATLMQALQRAGFADVAWHDLVAPDPDDFWADLLADQPSGVLVCT